MDSSHSCFERLVVKEAVVCFQNIVTIVAATCWEKALDDSHLSITPRRRCDSIAPSSRPKLGLVALTKNGTNFKDKMLAVSPLFFATLSRQILREGSCTHEVEY